VVVNRLDIADPALCLAVFKSNRDAGVVLFAAIVLDGLAQQGW
jgi:4-hydroxybenzoate polyprenyltransferase